ncbi:hypothetical protein MXB_1826 [Myxobolus squamalis]|nr:hypothetical protein MXB_1826 [Myxobolus squamalis]
MLLLQEKASKFKWMQFLSQKNAQKLGWVFFCDSTQLTHIYVRIASFNPSHSSLRERIMPNKAIFFKHAPIHPWHYSCSACGNELTEESKESNGVLYCLKCFDHNYATVCEICKFLMHFCDFESCHK